MNLFKRYLKKYTGFTLVELLVAVSIFSILIGIASGIFISAIQAQRRSLTSQELLDQTSYIMEYMSRALRMARKELNCIDPAQPFTCQPENPPRCLTDAGYGHNYETNLPDRNRIRFLNFQYKCQEFFLKEGQIKERKSTDHTAANFEGALPLTSTGLLVESFDVGPSESWDQEDNEQPRVTMFFEVRGAGEKAELQPEIRVQTTISQRNLDIQY